MFTVSTISLVFIGLLADTVDDATNDALEIIKNGYDQVSDSPV